ncbi:MAG: glycyl-radical enzyme activating protein [Deltaproteobacteria bacterium]|nr:glycyl-radical enzyme activating protein [Deltaproteobacteria bacterium]
MIAEKKGLLLEIQRFSTDDGPGIRTTVFMKGCPLACRWCHNPESISPLPQVQWLGVGCLLCGECVAVCRHEAIAIEARRVVIKRASCAGCGECADNCPSAALKISGSWWGVEELSYELQKDRAYFLTSGGGVTVSGGEAGIQHEFVARLLAHLAKQGIHTAIDTSGHCSETALAALVAHARLVLFDLKMRDTAKHRMFVGQGNERILNNARFLANKAAQSAGDLTLWIRSPIIPGATDDEENIRALGAFIATELEGIPQRWELCAFNNLCRDKYGRLGLQWEYHDTELVPQSKMESLAAVARSSGVDPAIVFWSGPVAQK